MEDVERAFKNYKEDEDNKELYWKRKEAVYSLSLVLEFLFLSCTIPETVVI